MAVTGSYMADRVRDLAAPFVVAYGRCVIENVLPIFTGLADRATEIANAEFERRGRMPAGFDCDGDMGAAAEAAQSAGLTFYETMTSLRQTTLNLFAAGLFHLVEQHLAELCRDGAFRVAPPDDTKLAVVSHWFQGHFALNLSTIAEWPHIDQLRHLANAVKHSEGASARQLRERRPDLFIDPRMRELWPGLARPAARLRVPLAGDDLFVTEDVFAEYLAATTRFLTGIEAHFRARPDELFPR